MVFGFKNSNNYIAKKVFEWDASQTDAFGLEENPKGLFNI